MSISKIYRGEYSSLCTLPWIYVHCKGVVATLKIQPGRASVVTMDDIRSKSCFYLKSKSPTRRKIATYRLCDPGFPYSPFCVTVLSANSNSTNSDWWSEGKWGCGQPINLFLFRYSGSTEASSATGQSSSEL